MISIYFRERVKSQIQRNRNEVQFSISDKSVDIPIKTGFYKLN